MKKRDQFFVLAILTIFVVAGLFYFGKIGSFTFEGGNDKTRIEIKAPESKPPPSETAEPKTAQNDAAPSMQIKVGNIEETDGHVQVGKDQTITGGTSEPPAEPKSPSPLPTIGNTSISVGNIKETKGNVQVGSGQTIQEIQPQKEKSKP